jgi:SAM-dependent methyltransferase
MLRSLYRKLWALPRVHRAYQNLSLSETFARIYTSGAWAPSEEQFSSGSGSAGAAADEYCRHVVDFIRTHEIQSIVDLGCGDFRIGRRLVSETSVRYLGVDIVRDLIDWNNARFSSERIAFACADLTKERLPQAQLCLVRQVLQHLSNAEIQAALTHICKYPLALISEHVPKKPKSFNRDKPHGPDVRAYYGSGVYVEKPPFSRKATLLWETALEADSVLRTVLLAKL